MPPLVAIVTPVYNGAAYLVQMLDSVQAQTHPRLVHVVLDNASTDETAAILARYEGARVPVRVRRTARTIPMADNWNAAVRAAPPEAAYFQLLCADDTLDPACVSRMAAVAESDPLAGVVGCQWRASGLCGEELPKEVSVFEGVDVVRRYLRRETMVLSGMFTLFRKEMIDPKRPFYDGSMKGFDADANVRTALKGRYGFVHEELVRWRLHPDSATSQWGESSRVHMAEWLVLLDRYGAAVLAPEELRKVRRAWRRHYLRRILLMRLREGRRDLFRDHLAKLQARGDGAGPMDFADAMLDWARLWSRGRRGEVGRAV